MANQILLSNQSRVELATRPPYNVTSIRWYHDTKTLTGYKVRLGGTSHSTGKYVPVVGGSKNTEDLSGIIPAGTIIETTIAIDDLLRIDDDEDGIRLLGIFGRDQATGEWLTPADGALAVPIYLWRRPPVITVGELTLDNREIGSPLVLSATREFKVTRQNGSVPSGATQAVEVTFADLSALGDFTSTQAVFTPHVDGTGPQPTTVTFPTNDLGSLNILTEKEEGDIRFLAEDAFGQKELRILPVVIRATSPFAEVPDPRYRDAVPPRVRDKDQILMEKYLPVWDAAAGQFDAVVDGMQTLVDPETMPAALLPFAFREMGLLYPDIPGYPEENLRRILLKANEIHSTRYTEPGLLFYLGLLLPDASVTISGLFRGAFFFPNSRTLGLPTLAQINSAATANNQNNYLFGPNIPEALAITITGGSPSAQMQEFVRSTIRRELLYADDPVNPRTVSVVFVP